MHFDIQDFWRFESGLGCAGADLLFSEAEVRREPKPLVPTAQLLAVSKARRTAAGTPELAAALLAMPPALL